jgi:inhibitor of cysteine peptidase
MAIILTERDDGCRIEAHVGDAIQIQLVENASSGYRWSLGDLDSNLLQLNDSIADYPAGAIGAGGHARFDITVRVAGVCTVRLKYWRPWEGEAGVRRRFAVDVVATD